MPHVAERLLLNQQALLLAKGLPIKLGAVLGIKSQLMLPIKVKAKPVVVLLLLTVVAVLVTVALAEIVNVSLAHAGPSAMLQQQPIGVVVNHMLILQGEYFHLRRVLRYRQSSHCWKPGWRMPRKRWPRSRK